MARFTHRLILFPYPSSKADRHRAGPESPQRGDYGDAMVKIGQWENKWKRDMRPPWWQRCFGSETPDLPAAFCFSDSEDLNDKLGELVDQFSQLYIVGHCDVGAGSLGSGDQDYSVSAADVFKMIESGLPAYFNGVLKIYACFSALGQQPDWGIKTAGSFADAFARLAYAKWPSSTVYGYNKAVQLGGPAKAGPRTSSRMEMDKTTASSARRSLGD